MKEEGFFTRDAACESCGATVGGDGASLSSIIRFSYTFRHRPSYLTLHTIISCQLSSAASLLSNRITVLPLFHRLYIPTQKLCPNITATFLHRIQYLAAIQSVHFVAPSRQWRRCSMQIQNSLRRESFVSHRQSPYSSLFLRPLPVYPRAGTSIMTGPENR